MSKILSSTGIGEYEMGGDTLRGRHLLYSTRILRKPATNTRARGMHCWYLSLESGNRKTLLVMNPQSDSFSSLACLSVPRERAAVFPKMVKTCCRNRAVHPAALAAAARPRAKVERNR